MTGTHSTWVVVLSILVAIATSHAALSLAQRMSRSSRPAARLWLAGGALSMGIGIWSMHFIAMMAFQLPIRLAYDIPLTLLSLALSVGASGFALTVARERAVSTGRLVCSALVLGTGISGMHYVGMQAITVTPRLSYDPLLFLASIAIAISASFVALVLFFGLRALHGARRHVTRAVAAAVMGIAIAGLHYTGMAATHFAPDAWCSGGVALSQNWIALLIAVVAMGLIGITALLLLVDSHLAARIRRHSDELLQVNEQLHIAATHDPLTGLPNRTLLIDRVSQAVVHGRRNNFGFAVATLNLDRFKTVNDTLGPAAADDLLQLVTRRITATLRNTDTLARMGGDEFVVLLPRIATREEALAAMQGITAAIGEPAVLCGVEVQPAASLGVAIFPADGTDALTLLKNADAAMHHVKRNGRNGIQFYASGMCAVDRDSLELEAGLRKAVGNDELLLYYQPKVDVRTGRIQGAEALLRWRHPTRGLISPGVFIPIAEASGLIASLGDWALREACRQLRQWHDAGHHDIAVAVNLSAEQLSQSCLVDRVRAVLQEFDLPPACLELELTESAVMRDSEQSVRLLREIASLGIRISVDDFGTGYSSLSYLRRLPLHALKIDRSFIREVAANRDDAQIVRAIVSMAHNLSLEVTAEGVETHAQLDFIRSLRCEQYQGFLCSPPLPAAQFIQMVQKAGTGATSRLRRLLPLAS